MGQAKNNRANLLQLTHPPKKKKKKKATSKTLKIVQIKSTVTFLIHSFLNIEIYIVLINLHCKHIKIGKCCTNLQNLYNFFFFFLQMYIIFATFFMYII